MPTLRDLYLKTQQPQQAEAAPAAALASPADACKGNTTSANSRNGAFRKAGLIKKARPEKHIVVYNIFGHSGWFVRTFTEHELRQFLADSKTTRPWRRPEKSAKAAAAQKEAAPKDAQTA